MRYVETENGKYKVVEEFEKYIVGKSLTTGKLEPILREKIKGESNE